MENQTAKYENWKHFDVKPLKGQMKEGHLVYSISSNNFGDQVIHYRRYQLIKEDEFGSWYGLVTYHTEANQEGSWVPHEIIKNTAKQLWKSSKGVAK